MLIIVLFISIAVVVANPIISSWKTPQGDITLLLFNGSAYLNGTMMIESLVGTYTNNEAYLCVYNNGTIFAKDSVCD